MLVFVFFLSQTVQTNNIEISINILNFFLRYLKDKRLKEIDKSRGKLRRLDRLVN